MSSHQLVQLSVTSPTYLPPLQWSRLEAAVDNALQPAIDYCEASPDHRDPQVLPLHIAHVTNTLIDVQQTELSIPPTIFSQIHRRVVTCLNCLDDLQLRIFDNNAPAPTGQVWETLPNGGRRLILDIDLLLSLMEEGMTEKIIGQFLNCSERTVRRRKKELHISSRQWTALSDEDLCAWITRVWRHGSGDEGEKGITAGLRDLGIRVPRERVRQCLQTMDRVPLANGPSPLVRRVYRVPWINSLWHIDGHHKLIPWKIVIHGGIDGHSRMVTFMRASDNNRAPTVLQAFKEAVQLYGWPSRVRADYGKENWDVKKLMEDVRGHQRGSFIQGPSTRNQRIERLWVDLQKWCTNRYKKIFIYLEHQHLLSVDNPYQLWALHLCYLPMLNAALETFVRKWNFHDVRTEGNRTPRQMWLLSQLKASQSGVNPMQTPISLLEAQDPKGEALAAHDSFADYGVDDYGLRATFQPVDSDPYVEVEPTLRSVPEDVVSWLTSTEVVCKLKEIAGPYSLDDPQVGISRYLKVVDHINSWISQKHPQIGHVGFPRTNDDY